MKRVLDKDGVDIVVGPANGEETLHVNIDFDFAHHRMAELNNRVEEWDLNLVSGRTKIARAKFAAFQFFSGGIERRTISLRFLEMDSRQRGKRKSYDIAKHIVDEVNQVCDLLWGPVPGNPVLFIEQRHFTGMPKKDQSKLVSILTKIGKWALGVKSDDYVIPDSDLVVSVVGENLSLDLIEGHLTRSVKANDGRPGNKRN